MIDYVQTPANRRPLAKAVHQFSASSSSKWVPINRSFQTLTLIILRAAAERLGLLSLAVTLRCVTHQGYRHLVLVSRDESIQLAAVGREEEFIISTEASMTPVRERLTSTNSVTLTINYMHQRLGYLHAQLPVRAELSLAQLECGLGEVVDELLGVVQRYQTRHRAIYIYGDQAYWVGHSEALRQLELRIQRLAGAAEPVLIRGDKGTGKVIAARSLHCARYSEMVAFIESSCNEWEEGAAPSILEALFSYARGGSLYLRNIDKLSLASLTSLREFWAQRAGTAGVTLMLSLSCRNGAVSPALSEWIERELVELYMPGLTERLPDLRDLARFFMREDARSEPFDFTEEAWQILEALEWRHNVAQLKSLMQRLTLVVEAGPVSAALLFSVISA